ncbi:two-component regulator propeller domain-containing protein [Reichenbachiella sp.]
MQATPVVGSTLTDTLQINYIGQEKGIKQLNVQKIVQDDLDYLWFSTEDGLHRFNGLQMKVFADNPLDSSSIPDDHNRGLLIVEDTLWIASNSKGIFALDLRTEQFSIPFPEMSGAISYQVFQLNHQYLLFSLADVFYVLNRKTRQLTPVKLPRSNSENYVKNATAIDEHQFLLATLSSGLLIFDLKKLEITGQTSVDQSSHNAIVKLRNQWYIGTDQAFYRYDLKTNGAEVLIDNQLVNCVSKIEDDKLLLGTKNGLLRYHLDEEAVSQIILKDQNNRIFTPLEIESIYSDDKGNIWFGTAGEGLHHYNKYQKKFETIALTVPGYSKDTKLSTFQILPGKDSVLWLGTSSNVIRYNLLDKKFNHYKGFPDALIYALSRDENGGIWCGGFDGTGLLKYNESNDKFVKVDFLNQKNDKTIIDIRPLSQQQLLLSTWSSGMFVYNIETNMIEEFLVDGKQLNRARISFVDSKDNLWIGSDQGVYLIGKRGKGKSYHLHENGPDSIRINSNRIFGINEDSRGDIWLGTSTGLTQVSTDNWHSRRYYRQEGFPNDFIYGVLIDANDHVWVSTNQGISVFNPNTLEFKSYSAKDGLQNDEFNGKAAFQDKQGNFYFGGVDGINIFNPLQINTNPFQPQVHLESIEIFNSPISKNSLYSNNYIFKSEENVLSFQYAATNFLNPSKVNYSFYMEGFDKDWRPATKSQQTTYTNLPSGDYKFKIKATNDNGTWGDFERVVNITIVPPWYETWWFRIAAVLLLVLTISSYAFYKYASLKRNKALLKKIVQERTKELSEALNVSNNQKESITFLMRELKHRVKNNLQIISSLLSLQAMQMKDKASVEILHSAKNRISNISYLENMMDSENEHVAVDIFTKGICENVLRLIAVDEAPMFEVDYDMEPSKVANFNITIYGLIINELLTNTSKYAFDKWSEKNKIFISCSVKKGTLVLIIADNGKGYDHEAIKSSSLGLGLVKDMVSQLNGTITIENNKGVKNIIRIPVNHE